MILQLIIKSELQVITSLEHFHPSPEFPWAAWPPSLVMTGFERGPNAHYFILCPYFLNVKNMNVLDKFDILKTVSIIDWWLLKNYQKTACLSYSPTSACLLG